MILVQQFHNNRFFILLGSALLLLGVLFLFFFPKKQPVIQTGFTDAVLTSGDIRIAISIADTPEEREQGLSNTYSLPVNTGKFFVFEEPALHGFWMKDMNYAIDIIWFDEAMNIVSIAQNVVPESYPEVVYPENKSLYVLEVSSGFSTAKSLKKGQSFTQEK